MIDYEILKLVWWLFVGVLLVGFAVMDGQDMGVGSLLPFLGKNDTERRVMINTVAPHWDGNQVWLLTGGGAIFAAWPLVYATAFSGLYWALFIVLAALILRPVPPLFCVRLPLTTEVGCPLKNGAPLGTGLCLSAVSCRPSFLAWPLAICSKACRFILMKHCAQPTPEAFGPF